MRRTVLGKLAIAVVAIAVMALFSSCSSTKHVPEGKMLLDKVKINISDPRDGVEANQLANYLRQNANHRVLGGLKLQLAFYNLSGRDSTKWLNRWIQRVGTPPVIYDSTLTAASADQLHMALNNRGYVKNTVTYRVDADTVKRKARVNYDVTLGDPYYIRSIAYDIPDEELRDIILADTTKFDENLLAKVTTGASLSVTGTLVESVGSGQAVEIQANEIEVLGECDPMRYPLQKKDTSMEYLRTVAHMRPRTNTFGAILRIRHAMAFAIHKFFNERGFVYVHTPLITASDCE